MREVYLDNSATTQTSPQVAQEMVRAAVEEYGNPSSLHHKGVEAQLKLEEAQKRVGALMGCTGDRVIFTSGGTESNNLAILGGVSAHRRRGNRIVTTAFEHDSVLAPFAQLEKQGLEAVYCKPDASGHISPQSILDAVNGDTILVSMMVVNNEVGTILPYEELAEEIKGKNPNVLIHCDAVQAFGKLPLKISRTQVDLMSVSGHKIHAPKGVGALYVKKGVRIHPILFGGSQQGGIRPGTENLPLACGMGLAAALCKTGLEESYERMGEVKAHLVTLLSSVKGVQLNSPDDALPYILNLSVPGYRSETMLHFLEEAGIYVSSASACTKGQRSHVLAAMGLPSARIDSALRVSFCRENTQEDVEYFVEKLQEGMTRLARVG